MDCRIKINSIFKNSGTMFQYLLVEIREKCKWKDSE